MTQLDPIIAVKDVEASAKWYESLFEWRNIHGGEHFAVLVSTKNEEVVLCMHKWGAHEHPSMKNPNLKVGNGLILYFRTENMQQIRQNLARLDYSVEADIRENPNSNRLEFSLRDPNGYYLTISNYHKYEG